MHRPLPSRSPFHARVTAAAGITAALLAPFSPVDEAAIPEHFRSGKGAGLVPHDWFHAQRAYPEVDFSPHAVRLASEQAAADRAALGGRTTPGRADGGAEPRGGGAWQEVGPVNIGGRITAVAIHPDRQERVFAGIAAGGVFRSEDGGSTWAPIFDSVGVPSIGAIALDPTNPDLVYVGTGEANASGDSFAGWGMYRSTDAGDTWNHLGLEETQHIGRVAIDPDDPSRIFVAALGGLWTPGPSRGVYRSEDGGASWDRVLFVSDSTSVVDLVLDPSNPQRVYAAAWERLRGPDRRKVGGVTSGIYRSVDGGDTWSLLTSGLPNGPTVGRIGLAVAESAPQTLYAIYADDPGYFAGLYKSTNGGNSWSRVNDGGISDVYASYGWYFGNVRVSPTDPNDVYAMGLIFYRSTNGGTSWSERWIGSHVDHHDHWIDPFQPARQILAGDGGLYLSSDDGGSWSHVQTLPITQFYAGTVDPQNPARIYGGAQDNGTSRTVTGSTDDWDEIYGGDGFYCLVHPNNSSRIWAEYQYGNLYYSSNDAGSWTSATGGIPSGERRNWATPVIQDPNAADTRYYGTYRVWRSASNTSWTPISGDLTEGTNTGYHTITTIAAAPGNSQRIYAGTADGRVWTTSNGGGSWTRVDAGLPPRWVTRVMVDPSDPLVAYVAHSGYRWGESLAHLHRTTNAGASWTAIDGGLPESPVNALALDPEVPGRLFAGLDVGVYVSENAGGHWEPYGAGMPAVVIHDLVFHESSRQLTAFTHARSAFRIDVPVASELEPIDPRDPLAAAAPGLRLQGPNPFRDRFVVTLRAPGGRDSGVLSLVDAQGRAVRSRAVRTASGGGSIELAWSEDLERLPRGTYYLRWASPEGEVWGRARVVRLAS